MIKAILFADSIFYHAQDPTIHRKSVMDVLYLRMQKPPPDKFIQIESVKTTSI